MLPDSSRSLKVVKVSSRLFPSYNSRMSSIQVLPCTLKDVPDISRIHLRAWLTNTLYGLMYFKGYQQSTVDAIIKRHTKSMTEDPSTRYLKAVRENDTSTMQAFAKINIFRSISEEEDRQDAGDREWPDDLNRAAIEEFWEKLKDVRNTWGPQLGAHVQVDLVACDPQYFRQGAGRALMKHIERITDEEGLPGFIEASPDGEKLYASVGFEFVGQFWTDYERFPDGWDKGANWRVRQGRETKEGVGEGWYRQILMVRPAKGKVLSDYLG